MRFQSGITDQYIYFMAVDSTDLKTAETGLSSFTVYRARNGGAATAYTTPTIAEVSAANMPGVYSLLLDEDMTIDAGDDSQAVVLRITQAAMAPVTLMFELYRPIVTAGSTITVANGCADADIERLQGSAIATPSVAGVIEVDVTHFNGTAGTFASGRPEVNTSHIAGSDVSTSSAQIGVNVVNAAGTAWGSGAITAASIAASALNGKGNWNIGKTGYALSAAGIQEIWDALTSALTTVGSIGKLLVDNINATISSRLASASYTAPLDAAGTRAAVGLATANLDTQLTAIDDFLDTEVAAIKAKTDSLTFTVAGQVDANIQYINDVAIVGDGSGTPFNV